jgi:predicted RNA-binding Zn ribbon-like protein
MDEKFLFVGNLLCLDFVNTEVMGSEGRRDLLEGFEDVADWLRAAGVVTEEEARGAAARWGGEPLDAVRRFRALLREAAERLSGGQPVPDEAVAAVNELLARPVRVANVRRTADGFEAKDGWVFREAADLLVPVAESARDLLCDRDPALVRKCRNPQCILYFYDTTKNRGRAWCSMSACGNRTKVAAHYRRRRARKD